MHARTRVGLGTVAALVLVARGVWAQPATPDVTDLEFSCMRNVAKHGAKAAYNRFKCVTQCVKYAWKGVVDPAECQPPYGGATSVCLVDNAYHRRGVEDKYLLAIRKACDATLKPGRECPTCYSPSNDCSATGAASDWVQREALIADSFVPGVFCEVTGAGADELNCQRSTAKGIAKWLAASTQCYDKCFDNARRGVWQFSDCDVSAPQGGTAGCLNAARAKYAAYIDKECHPAGALPDCPDPDNYPDGDTWIGLADNWIFNDIPAEFCGS